MKKHTKRLLAIALTLILVFSLVGTAGACVTPQPPQLPGTITIEKFYSGVEALPDTLAFQVTGPLNDPDCETKTVLYSNFSNFFGYRYYTLFNMKPGDYTVTEINGDVDGYTLEVAGDNGATKTLHSLDWDKFTFTNTYTPEPEPETGTLTVTKSVVGPIENDPNLAGLSFSFTISDANGVVTTDANGDPIGTNGVFSLSDGGSAAFTLNEGTYTVAEQDATVTGYNLATTYNGLSVDSIAIEVTADGASVTVMNTYTIPEPTTGTLSVTKSVNNQQGGDAVFTFNYALMDSQERLISGSFTLKNGETWTYDGELPIGTSVTIEEDEALMPANYAPVSAPIESTIAAGANAFTYVNTFNQPFVPQTVYYNLTLNWLEEGTGTILKPATTTPYVQMAPYDASSIAEIENYTYVRAEGDALTGTMNSSKVITFYYTANAIEDETEEIEENDTPLAEVPEEEPPVEEPVVEETPVIDIETDEVPLDDVPQTGDTNNTGILWLILGAGLAGLTTLGFLGKKAKKTR